MASPRGSNGGGEARWSVPAALPELGNRVLSASALVAYVAVGAAAILSRSVTEAAGDALAWVLPRDGEAQQSKGLTRASRLLVATVVAALLGTPAKVSDGVAPDPVEQRRAT